MWHRLALALGGTVTDLQDRMPNREWLDWAALWTIEPWGDVREDMHAAQITTVLANINRDRKQRRKAYTLEDFMPDFWKRVRGDVGTRSNVKAKAMALFGALTGNTDGE